MKEYTIIKKPVDFHWGKIPALDMNESFHDQEIFIHAQAQICYDQDALYVRLSCNEREIRAELCGPLDEVCEDSCMEFFFSPMEGDRRYFNIESNLKGTIYLGFGSDPHNLVRLIPEENPIKPLGKKTEDGWELTYHIPFEFIRRFFPDFNPKSGSTIRGNVFKCGEKTKIPHYFFWNPTPFREFAAFHNPDGFGLMHFE